MPDVTDILSSQPTLPPKLPIPSPREILEDVAREMTQKVAGVLEGEISTRSNNDATMVCLDMVAPALEGASQPILAAIHPNGQDYTVWIYTPVFPRSLNVPPYAILTSEQEKEDFVAHDADEFRRLVAKVMASDDVTWLSAKGQEEVEDEPDDEP